MLDIRITDDDVKEWRAQREDLKKRIEELDRKLEFVELFTKNSESAHSDTLPGIDAGFSEMNKPDKILAILRDRNEYMSPREIKEALHEQGETEDEWANKYVYVHQVLKRLVDQGKIRKGTANKKYRFG